MIMEEQRITDEQVHLEEDELEVLNQKLSMISDELRSGRHPELTFTVFIPDEHKAGGRYETITGPVKKIDLNARKVILAGAGMDGPGNLNRVLEMNQIIEIQ